MNKQQGDAPVLDILRVGQMVRDSVEESVLFAEAERMMKADDTAFGALTLALGLDASEALCVAWGLCGELLRQPPALAEVAKLCRRLGGTPGAWEPLFLRQGDTAVLHPVVTDFLLGQSPRLPNGMELLWGGEEPLFAAEPLCDELANLLKNLPNTLATEGLLLALRGTRGSGRRFLAAQIAAKLGRPLLIVNEPSGAGITDILLTVALYRTMVCLTGNQMELEELAREVGALFLLLNPGEGIPEQFSGPALIREIPEPDESARCDALRYFLGGTVLEDALVKEIGRKRLSIGSVRCLAGILRAECAASGQISRSTVLRAVGEVSTEPDSGLTPLTGSVSLDNLSLPPEQHRQLRQLCTFVRQRSQVYNTWGFAEKVPWGRGISALFYGAPGTGKTMAAAAVARETDLDLMKTELSALMSKYIGETQKNIGRVFDEAKRMGCILFFDEADALFARRGEAGDAQDKYANAETAYLLQRMEEFDGVCILATNLLQNFDEAFRRRIGYMIHFPMPDASLRERIWRGIFPKAAPVEELNYPLLAEQLELSGASIKNCAVHAAYLASAQGSAITTEFILEGARLEYGKLGKTLDLSSFTWA